MSKITLTNPERLENLVYMKKRYTRMMWVRYALGLVTILGGIIHLWYDKTFDIYIFIYPTVALIFYASAEGYKDLRNKAKFWENVIKDRIKNGVDK